MSSAMPNLTLYGIETELMQLIAYRDAVLEDPELTPEEQKESLVAIDESILEYVKAEVKKVDGIAYYLREFETRAAAVEAEMARLKHQRDMWHSRGENLKQLCIQVMQTTGNRRLEGRLSTLSLRKCPASVEVAQPELVPADFQRVRVTMSKSMWDAIVETLGSELAMETCKASEAEPMKSEIKAVLQAGAGVPGCTLVTDKDTLVVT